MMEKFHFILPSPYFPLSFSLSPLPSLPSSLHFLLPSFPLFLPSSIPSPLLPLSPHRTSSGECSLILKPILAAWWAAMSTSLPHMPKDWHHTLMMWRYPSNILVSLYGYVKYFD